MNPLSTLTLIALNLLGFLSQAALAQATTDAQNSTAGQPAFTREFDIIYHKQDGFALTMEKVAPKKNGNGAAVILVMSGGWLSNHDATKPHDAQQLPNNSNPTAIELLTRGYTLFYVVHGSQPKFTIREIHTQLCAAVRYIRHHAADYGIDAERIGIMGGSAGGHLSLLQGTKGIDGQANATEQQSESSRVQAVVAYFPPTDFLNYGQSGVFFDQVVREVIPDGKDPYLQAFDLLEFDGNEVRLNKITDADRLAEHYKDIAPLNQVTSDDAPALLLHGDADRLVPLQQSETIAAKFKEAGVDCRLYIKKGAGHGWQSTPEEVQMIADWFDDHLKR